MAMNACENTNWCLLSMPYNTQDFQAGFSITSRVQVPSDASMERFQSREDISNATNFVVRFAPASNKMGSEIHPRGCVSFRVVRYSPPHPSCPKHTFKFLVAELMSKPSESDMSPLLPGTVGESEA